MLLCKPSFFRLLSQPTARSLLPSPFSQQRAPPPALLASFVRFHWTYLLQKHPDPVTGELKYEDWEDVIKRAPMSRLQKNGEHPLDRHRRLQFHIKTKTLKKYKTDERAHNRSAKKVMDLIKYIHFKQEFETE